MLVIICTNYGKNPSRTVDTTKRTRFSRPRPNDLEDIGQGQRSLYATHCLMLMIICDKYGKNPSRTVDFIFQGQGRKISKIAKNSNIQIMEKTQHATHPLIIVIIVLNMKKNPSRTGWTLQSGHDFLRPWRYRSRSRVITCYTSSHAIDHLERIHPELYILQGGHERLTDRQTGWIQYAALTSLRGV